MLDALVVIEPGGGPSRQSGREAGSSDKLVTAVGRWIGPGSEGLPAIKGNAERAAYPKLDVRVLAKPVREFGATLEVRVQPLPIGKPGELVSDGGLAASPRPSGRIVVKTDNDVGPV